MINMTLFSLPPVKCIQTEDQPFLAEKTDTVIHKMFSSFRRKKKNKAKTSKLEVVDSSQLYQKPGDTDLNSQQIDQQSLTEITTFSSKVACDENPIDSPDKLPKFNSIVSSVGATNNSSTEQNLEFIVPERLNDKLYVGDKLLTNFPKYSGSTGILSAAKLKTEKHDNNYRYFTKSDTKSVSFSTTNQVKIYPQNLQQHKLDLGSFLGSNNNNIKNCLTAFLFNKNLKNQNRQ